MKPFEALEIPLEGVSLVEASAGTGKTYAISTLFVRLLLERGLQVGQVLVVTFTEAATAELRDRIRRRLQESITICDVLESGSAVDHCDPTLVALLSRQSHVGLARNHLRSALFQFDAAPIFTIHGFCQRVLRENAFATRVTFDAELMQDIRPLVEEVLTDYWISEVSDAPLPLIAQLDKGKFTPKERDMERFSNFVAQATHLLIEPQEPVACPPIREARVAEAFARAQQHFEPAMVDELLKPVYPRKDHRASREREMMLFLKKPFGSQPLPDKSKYFDPSEWKLKKGLSAPSHPFFDAIHELRSAYADLQVELNEHALGIKRRLIEFLRKEVHRRKVNKGVLSFDDLLQQVYTSLQGALGSRLAATLRSRYHAALIDEFQDTDPIQYGIFSGLFEHSVYSNDTGLFLIGDPKQAIYSFRGADVFAYLNAANSVPEERRFTMGTNYRSDERLVAAVNALFMRHPRPFVYEALTYPDVAAKHSGPSALTPEAPPLEVRFIRRPPNALAPYSRFEVERLLPERVADQVVTLLESKLELEGKPLSPKSIAILTRTNREAFDCQRALADRGVPNVVQGDRSVFEQPEARELQLILSAVAEPSSASAIRTALATELMGKNAEALDALDADEEAWDGWVERFRGYLDRWRADGFVQMFRQLLLECGITQRLLASPTGERRMTNVLHLSELLHTQAQAEHLGPSGLLQYLAEQRQRETTPTESEQVRLESDEDAVVLTTIHKSKGLEYPIVICPFLCGAASFGISKQWVDFHDEQSRAHVLDLGTPEIESRSALKARENMSEALRLLYVAFTRARHRCIVYWGALGEFPKSAMAELLYGPLEGDGSALKKVDDATLAAPLLELSRSAAGCSLVFEPELVERSTLEPPPRTLTLPRGRSGQFRARDVSRRVSHWSRTASFTELTRFASAHHAAVPATDHDELVGSGEGEHDVERPSDTGAAQAGSARGMAAAHELSMSPNASTPDDQVTLAGFPGGATTGNFFHSVLEEIDFQSDVSPAQVQAKLLSHGIAEVHLTQALSGLRDALNAPFHGSLALAHIPAAQRLNELGFTLPVTDTLDSRSLAKVFSDAPSEVVPAEYGRAIGGLPFSALKGFLKGFVDLVFRHEDRWYLVDYKTNDLGRRYSDYGPQTLRACMSDSHYILQYHLYTLALDRYLRLRLNGYDYERHFGGVYYLFLRGMSPTASPQCGVFFEKPPERRLALLSEAFGQ